MALKLSASDKQTIVELYQHPEESTATLASRYGVSSSTISRVLKQELSTAEYQRIVQQKKGGGSKPLTTKPDAPSANIESPQLTIEVAAEENSQPSERSSDVELPSVDQGKEVTSAEQLLETPAEIPSQKKRVKIRKRSSAKAVPEIDEEDISLAQQGEGQHNSEPAEVQLSLSDTTSASDTTPAPPILKSKRVKAEALPPEELVDEIQADLLEREAFALDDDLGGDDLEDEELDDGDELDDESDLAPGDPVENSGADDFGLPFAGDTLSVLPFSEAKLPQTCYVIVDRSAELITRPLRTFADLGNVPDAEVDEQTLPIFDNHRVAKRFANRRTQRIVKVPDAQVLRKTSHYLMDKGITRLLLDGQVYALIDDEEFEEE
ncbi:MAG: hypothetical protein F6K16_38660 [Symploca sp. SIO2B6]|nr:hypothetical protein [Symploca sp. SIO2B6]